MSWQHRQLMRPFPTATPRAVAGPHASAANSLCASAALRDENSSRTSRTLREIKTTTCIWDDWNTNGEIVAHYDYSPFGEPLVASGPLAATFTHQFSTKPYCAVTGFSEYQMRKYRPEIGRWMSRDPIGEETEVEVSRYCFIQNFSVNTTDYLGLWGCIPTPPRQSLPQKPAKKCCGDTEYDPKTECCLEEEDDGADEMVPGTEVGSTATTQNATDGEAILFA